MRREIVRSADSSDYFFITQVHYGFFGMLNPFLHLEMDFKQQKIMNLCKFISLDSDEKNHFVEQIETNDIYLGNFISIIIQPLIK